MFQQHPPSQIEHAPIDRAIGLLEQGRLVAFPTETVYGLGANARNQSAILKVFQAKQRPLNHPLIIHIGQFAALEEWVQTVSDPAEKLIQAFWPGPLTLVLPKRKDVPGWVTAGQPNIALRMPQHPLTLQLLKDSGLALVGPSANQFGRLSPTTAAAVEEAFKDINPNPVDLILDGGPCQVGIESTIVYFDGKQMHLLRPGMISAEAMSAVTGTEVLIPQDKTPLIKAPGQCEQHYAPRTPLLIVSNTQIKPCIQGLTTKNASPKMALLGFSELLTAETGIAFFEKMPQNPAQYAHSLYERLRLLDHGGFDLILLEAPPADHAEWQAIWNRITRAATNRVE